VNMLLSQNLIADGHDYYFSSTHQFFPKKWAGGVDELGGRNYEIVRGRATPIGIDAHHKTDDE